MAGLAGESQNFDGNGQYVRFQPGGGTQTISTGQGSLSGDQLFGRTPEKPLGTRPAYPQQRPPYRPDVACHTNTLPDLNSARTGPPDASTGPDGSSGGTPLPGIDLPTPSLTQEMLDRLNPFRTRSGG
jgi:hypothetical protein